MRWDQWVEEFTPDTLEENNMLRVSRVGALRPWRELGHVVELRHLRYVFARARSYEPLNIPLAFLREGRNMYDSGLYHCLPIGFNIQRTNLILHHEPCYRGGLSARLAPDNRFSFVPLSP